MKYRLVQILASEAATVAGTKVLDLNLNTPCSRIVVRMKGTNSTSTPINHPAAMLKKIELVDGSDVLYSLHGFEAGCLNFHENSELPFYCNEYENNIQCCATAQLNFGRFLWDRDYALDPKKFSNLQLKISHDKALGGSTPDAGTLAVFAYVFEDSPPTPRGFMMAKELYSYSLTASAHEYINLPLDYPFRFVILQSYDTTRAPNDQFGNLKFTIDTDRRVLLNDISMTEYLKVQIPRDMVEEQYAGLGTAGAVSYYQAATYDVYTTAVGRSHSQTTLIAGQSWGRRVQITNDASESFQAIQTGYAPFGGVDLLMSDRNDPTSWLSPLGSKSIQLDITAAATASGTAYIVIQQERSY